MDKNLKIAVILSAYDKMSTVVNATVDRAQRKLSALKKTQDGLNNFGNAALLGGGIATAYFATTLKAAEESEQAGNRLKQVFKSMGEANDNAANAALDYAGKLQMQIGVEDELIAATQAKIATFKTVSNEAARMAGIFDRATAAAFDMQATGFGDAAQNAVQLGKALEDPIKGITSLRKSGITFTDAERQKIQVLVESGKKLKAQQLILAAIEKQVGGVAKATATGSSKAKVAWSEVSESIGKILLPKVNALAGTLVNSVIPKVQAFIEQNPKLVKWLAAGSVALVGLGAAAKVIAFGMGGLTSTINVAGNAIKFLGNTIGTMARFLMANPILLVIAAIAAAAYLIYKNWDKIKAWFFNLWDKVKIIFSKAMQWIKNLFLNYTPAGLVIKHWDKIKAFFLGLWDKVKNIFANFWQNIKNFLLDYTPQGLIYKHWDEIVTYFTNIWQRVKDVFKNAWASIKSGIKSFFGGGSDVDTALNKAQTVMDQANKRAAITVTTGGNTPGSPMATGGILQPVPVNNSTSTMHFAPVINLAPGTSPQDAQLITDRLKTDFKTQMQNWEANKKRVSY